MQYSTITTSSLWPVQGSSSLYEPVQIRSLETDDPRIQALEMRLADLEETVENLWMATNVRDLL